MVVEIKGQKYAAEYESSKDNNKLGCYFGLYHKFGLVQRSFCRSDVASMQHSNSIRYFRV